MALIRPSELIEKYWSDYRVRFGVLVGASLTLSVLRVLKRLIFGVVPKNTVLEIVFDNKQFIETDLDRFGKLIFKDVVVFRELLEALELAGNERNIVGVVLRIKNMTNMNVAQVEELREALFQLKSKGKKLFAYAEAFGEFSPANREYYLASVCDQIYINPSGDVNITGLHAIHPFVKNTLEQKLGITPQIYQRKGYKNAANMFMQEKFTEAHRESVQSLLDNVSEVLQSSIAESRKIPIERFKELLKKVNFGATEARENGLIDGIAYEPEVYDKIIPQFFGVKTKKHLNIIFHSHYLEKAGRMYSSGRNVIALILAEGTIHTGESKTIWDGNTTIGSATLVRAIRQATEDKSVKVILFRINSGGGSYIASDAILNAFDEAKKAGKKIVVNFAGASASGGYFVSQFADKIVCQSTTLTGSIGVFGGKFYTREMWGKLGVTFDFVLPDDENGTMYSWMHPYSDSQAAKINEILDRIYADFTGKVAQGRNLSPEHVEKVAQGRVWTGREAKQHGLVDHIGGFFRAIEVAKEEAGLKGTIRLKTFPPPKTIWSQLRKPQNSQDPNSGTTSIFGNFLHTIQMVSLFFDFTRSIGATQSAFAQHLRQASHSGESSLAATPLQLE